MCSPRKMLCKHETSPQENNNAETSLKSHPRTDATTKSRSSSADRTPPGGDLFFKLLYLESRFLPVAYLTVASLAQLGISAHC